MSTTELHIPVQGTHVQRLADALNAAHLLGIKFAVGPNPHIRWDSITEQWEPAAAGAQDEDFPATWEGGHALVVQYGDEELIGRCQCGTAFGINRPDVSLDDFAMKWERHVMTDLS